MNKIRGLILAMVFMGGGGLALADGIPQPLIVKNGDGTFSTTTTIDPIQLDNLIQSQKDTINDLTLQMDTDLKQLHDIQQKIDAKTQLIQKAIQYQAALEAAKLQP